MKLKEFTSEQLNKIHAKYRVNCKECPFYRCRIDKDGTEHELFCWAYIKAWKLSNDEETINEIEIELKEGDNI